MSGGVEVVDILDRRRHAGRDDRRCAAAGRVGVHELDFRAARDDGLRTVRLQAAARKPVARVAAPVLLVRPGAPVGPRLQRRQDEIFGRPELPRKKHSRPGHLLLHDRRFFLVGP